MKLRGTVWLVLAIVITVLCYCYALYTPEFDSYGTPRTILGVLVGIVGLALVFTFPNVSKKKATLLIFGIATITRLAIFPTGASDDVNRYLWEGKLYAQGISPYTNVAEHESYVPHRDQFYEKMNHKDKPTAYPPFALHCFSMINKLGYNPTSYKIVFLLLDLLIIATILALLGHYHRPIQWALLYALSPISLLSFSAEGHFDVVMVLFLTFSILCLAKKWIIPCGIAVGLAISVKVMAAVAAPIILLKTGVKGIAVGIIVTLLPILLYYDDSLQMIQGILKFGSNRFNGPANQFFVQALGFSTDFAGTLCKALFFASWGIGLWLCIKNKFWISINLCLGSLIFFAPIIHFWYLSWLLPFIAIRPSLPWITLSITTPLYFTVWTQFEDTGDWGMTTWARWLFWTPFILACIMHLPRHLISIYYAITRPGSIRRENETPDWSVVIPTLNIDDRLRELIQKLEQQQVTPDEIIIIYSSDENVTDELHSTHFDIKAIHSPKGRGIQIKTGVEATQKDWCLVLHADNELQLDTFNKLNEAIRVNMDIVGGSLGQRFNRSAPGLLLIESMNDFRASLLQTSFGDQNQFFHRETTIKNQILTDQPLMEDIEMSDRIRLQGDTLHLAHESTVSAEKWKKKTYWSRFFTIVGFYAKYRMLFFSAKKRADLSKRFYKKYYPSA